MAEAARLARSAALSVGLSVALVLFAPSVAGAQTPASPPPPAAPSPQVKDVTGFVSPYEILRTVREAGFHALVRPLREGTTYVLRATDFRGILMRVVLDARTGAIRDVNRIVPANPDEIGMTPPYSAPGYAPPPYSVPPGYPPPEPSPALAAPPAAAPAKRETALAHRTSTPLPRPRPAGLDAQPPDKPGEGAKAPAVETGNAGVNRASSAAPGKAPAGPPVND